jgi:hypothetical protein
MTESLTNQYKKHNWLFVRAISGRGRQMSSPMYHSDTCTRWKEYGESRGSYSMKAYMTNDETSRWLPTGVAQFSRHYFEAFIAPIQRDARMKVYVKCSSLLSRLNQNSDISWPMLSLVFWVPPPLPQANITICPLWHDRFLSNPFLFIAYLVSYIMTRYVLVTDSTGKWTEEIVTKFGMFPKRLLNFQYQI